MTKTLFTWGYYGWGNHTPDLVEAVDAVETRRGFRPPIFVDIRIRRSVRAAGFTGPAFERLLGRDRWMKPRGFPVSGEPRCQSIFQRNESRGLVPRQSRGV